MKQGRIAAEHVGHDACNPVELHVDHTQSSSVLEKTFWDVCELVVTKIHDIKHWRAQKHVFFDLIDLVCCQVKILKILTVSKDAVAQQSDAVARQNQSQQVLAVPQGSHVQSIESNVFGSNLLEVWKNVEDIRRNRFQLLSVAENDVSDAGVAHTDRVGAGEIKYVIFTSDDCSVKETLIDCPWSQMNCFKSASCG